MFPLPQFIRLLGPLGVSGFALAGLVGVLVGWLATVALGRRVAPALLPAADDALAWVLLGALIGGRLGNQVAMRDLTWSPLTWFSLTGTSLSWAGGALGALAALLWWAHRRGTDARAWAVADLLAPGAALAMAVGWLGIPALGRPTAAPWRLTLPSGVGVQPLQPLGALAFAALAAALAWQLAHLDHLGQNVLTLLALGGAARFLLGFLEQGSPLLGPLTLTQLVDALLAVAATVFSLLQPFPRAAAPQEGAPPP